MVKCDLCIVRIENGMEPACVHTCTTGALQFGLLEELTRKKTADKSVNLIKAFLPDDPVS